MTIRLLSLLLLPVLSSAGVIATAGTYDPTCGSTVTQSGEFAASASLTCQGASASAGAVFSPHDPSGDFRLSAVGAKIANVPRIESAAEASEWLRVIGTNSPGYLRIWMNWYLAYDTYATPNRFQGAYVSFNGEYYPQGTLPSLLYVPFQPGTPVHLSIQLRGYAGAGDIFRQEGVFDSTLNVQILGISEIAAGPDENPMYIPGASWVAIPEPTTLTLLLAGVMAFWRFGVRR